MPVLSKIQVCGLSIAGIAGSNPTEDVIFVSGVCCVSFRQWPLRRADHSFREVERNVCVFVFVCVRLSNCV